MEKQKSYSLSRDAETSEVSGYRYVHYGDIHKQVADIITADKQLPRIKANDYVPLAQGDLVLADASEDYTGIAEPCVILHKPEEKIIAGLHTIALRPLNTDSLYLYYSLHTERFKKFGNHVGTGLKVFGITFNNIAKFEAGIPVLKEQIAIGNFFRTLDEIIHATQRKVALLKQLKAAYLQQMFPQDGEKVPRVKFGGFSGDWNEMKLGKIAETYSGGTPSVGIRSYYNGVIPFIRSAEINSDKTELYLSNDGLKNSSAKIVNVGTILYALYGATSGEVGRSKIAGAINQAILAIEPKEHYNSEFIFQWLRRQKESIVSTYLQGGQGNLSAAIIKELPITTPSFSEQTAIGNFLCNLDMQIKTQSEKVKKLKGLKSAYLQKMFI